MFAMRLQQGWHELVGSRGARLGAVMALGGLVLIVSASYTAVAQSVAPPEPPRPIAALGSVPVPVPPNLGDFLKDTTPGSAPMVATVQLGKALFWDMQVGSDEVQACASCHFAAGADNRIKNQVSPGLLDGHDTTFQVGGSPNYTLTAADFPFHAVNGNAVVRDSNDVVSSQGVFRRDFANPGIVMTPGKPASVSETCNLVPDEDGFTSGGLNLRRVEPRNAPTVINAVFNFRNFWDGRANDHFNGVSPFGERDSSALIYKDVGGTLQQMPVSIALGSLASQAVGPPGSRFEMSCDGRPFMKIGHKLLGAGVRPLAKQHVSESDSVLGAIARNDTGLSVRYEALIKAAFRPEYWRSGLAVLRSGARAKHDASITMDLKSRPSSTTLADTTFSQMEANFSLFFGLAVQMYESTLVADETPFDKFLQGDVHALTAKQKAGLGLFSAQFGTGQGKCDACHGGPELTNAAVVNVTNERLERMHMGNDGIAVYDDGFYNTAVRPTGDDLGVGGVDPIPGVGKPLSETAFCQDFIKQHPGEQCPIKNENANGRLKNTSISATIAPRPGEDIPFAPLAPQCPSGNSVFNPATETFTCDRQNVMGAFKTPGLRNVELTGPYMHNGGMSTLRQVVDFYNRGGDFARDNQDNLDPNIVSLGLTPAQEDQLVAFLLALTDNRVKFERAPFDHPQLFVPNGHPTITSDPNHPGQAPDSLLEIPAVGAGGSASQIRSFTAAIGESQVQP